MKFDTGHESKQSDIESRATSDLLEDKASRATLNIGRTETKGHVGSHSTSDRNVLMTLENIKDSNFLLYHFRHSD